MLKRVLGGSGIEASAVAFGAWAIGGWKWGGTDANASVDAIRASLESGVTLIDTAPVYGFGLSEEIVGKAIAGRRREDIIIATKCGLVWDREAGTLHGQSEGRSIYRTLDPDSVREELEASMRRLGVDYIDLYQTHWPDPASDMREVAETLDTLKQEGLVRAVGFCNASPRFKPRVLDAIEAVLAPVKALARDRGVPTERVVLAWTLAQPGVTHVLAGTRSVEQAQANAAAGELVLHPEEIEVIDQAAAAWPGFESLAEEQS